MLHWKLSPPNFFKVEPKEQNSRSEKDPKDVEPAAKLDIWELTSDQKVFVNKFYPEYAEKDPWSVLNWLYNKALTY